MNAQWFEKDDVNDHLLLFGRAIQGLDPFAVTLEPDPTQCHGGFCSFLTRTITVNPTIFAVPPTEQYLLTKALLVHEAGHRRYTAPTVIPAGIRDIANILEDERVEARMYEEFRGVRWLITRLAGHLYQASRVIDVQDEYPGEVVAYFLQLRWARRIGKPIKGALSVENQRRWETIEPLVMAAWQADESKTVDRIAAEIAEKLGLSEESHAFEHIIT